VNIFGVMLSYRDWSEPHGRFERTVTALVDNSAEYVTKIGVVYSSHGQGNETVW
jgi:hypothetical protein